MYKFQENYYVVVTTRVVFGLQFSYLWDPWGLGQAPSRKVNWMDSAGYTSALEKEGLVSQSRYCPVAYWSNYILSQLK